jgi:hypothetical protein
LRVQVAALEQALDLEQQKIEEQQITIADLGGKLNACLVAGSSIPMSPEDFAIDPDNLAE